MSCNITNNIRDIKNILSKSTKPLTANEIFEKLTVSKNINLSTVYRILKKLENDKLIQKSIKQDKIAYYEFITKKHQHHLVCAKCHNEIPIDICPIINEFSKKIESDTGYKILNHNLELTGICKKCQKNM